MPAGCEQRGQLSAFGKANRVSGLQERRGLRASTFIAANGGSLHAESRGPNVGTTMSLRLPTVAADTPELVDALDD